ncbi:MAG: PDZ domain-containing protein [Planctomycetota bacterium]
MLRTQSARGILFVTTLALAWSFTPSAVRADEDFRKELEQLVEKSSAELAKKLAEILKSKDAHKSFTEQVTKLVAKRYVDKLKSLQASLEAQKKELAKIKGEVTKRDQTIAQLKAKLEALSSQIAKTKKPAAKPSNAFLGINHVDSDRGAQVTVVHPNSPAAAAGVKANDLVVSVNGGPVTSESLSAALAKIPVGGEAKIAVIRGDKKVDLVAKLVDRDAFQKAQAAAKKAAQPKGLVMGIEVAEEDGALEVTIVDKGSTGEVIGLKVGDRIVKFNDKKVATTEAIAAAVKDVKAGGQFTVTTQRGKDLFQAIATAGAPGKLVKRSALSVATKPKPEPPKAAKKPAHLGIAVAEEDHGLVIERVVPGTGAAAYGILAGDVLKKLAGKDVKNIDELRAVAGTLKAGDRVSVVVEREKKAVAINDIQLGAKGEVIKKTAPKAKPKLSGKPGYLGISAYEDESDKSIVVQDVIAGTAAQKAGLKAGDVVLKVGAVDIKSFDSLESSLRGRQAGEKLVIVVKRGGKNVNIDVTLGEKPKS